MRKDRFFHEGTEHDDDRGHSLFETERLEDYAALVLSACILLFMLVLF